MDQQPVFRSPDSPPPENAHGPRPKKERRRGGVGRFFRGYLMVAGAAATIYVLVRLAILLLVNLGI